MFIELIDETEVVKEEYQKLVEDVVSLLVTIYIIQKIVNAAFHLFQVKEFVRLIETLEILIK